MFYLCSGVRFGTRFVLLLMLLCATTSAYGLITDPEQRRGDLNQFVQELSGVEGFALDPVEANRVIQGMDASEVTAMHQGLNSFGPWREIPVVMASLAEGREQFEREKLARALSEVGAPGLMNDDRRRLENFRADFLFLIDQLAAFGPLTDEHYRNQAAWLRSDIEQMPIEAVAALEARYIERALEIQMILSGAPSRGPGKGIGLHAAGGGLHTEHTPDCSGGCGIDVDCWIDKVDCYISAVGHMAGHAASLAADIATFVGTFFTTTIPNLVSDIAEMGTEVANFFVGVFNSVSNFVTNQFNAIVALLPTSVNDVLAYLGIDWNNVNWASIAGSIPTITPPCPQAAVDIAANACDRGVDALSGLLFDLAPDDGLSFAFKVGVAVIHYPLTYLCQCNDIAEAIAFADAQDAHRTLTSTNLDLQLSTRATQASLDALSVSLADLDGDVAMVEAKIDVIEATAGRIDSKTLQIEATSTRIENNTNIIEATTDRMHDKVDALTQGNTDQQEFVGDFDTLMKRLHIENNLLDVTPNVISSFQLPSVFGGMLETVGLVVADTIQMHIDSGLFTFKAERDLQKGDALRAVGDFAGAFAAYQAAYAEAVK